MNTLLLKSANVKPDHVRYFHVETWGPALVEQVYQILYKTSGTHVMQIRRSWILTNSHCRKCAFIAYRQEPVPCFISSCSLPLSSSVPPVPHLWAYNKTINHRQPPSHAVAWISSKSAVTNDVAHVPHQLTFAECSANVLNPCSAPRGTLNALVTTMAVGYGRRGVGRCVIVLAAEIYREAAAVIQMRRQMRTKTDD
jgi:hypothetical protein